MGGPVGPQKIAEKAKFSIKSPRSNELERSGPKSPLDVHRSVDFIQVYRSLGRFHSSLPVGCIIFLESRRCHMVVARMGAHTVSVVVYARLRSSARENLLTRSRCHQSSTRRAGGANGLWVYATNVFTKPNDHQRDKLTCACMREEWAPALQLNVCLRDKCTSTRQ
jgi:hypothetical protein